jgi:diadenosine tetraphosphate (Ap4A) HIT family hydrolase
MFHQNKSTLTETKCPFCALNPERVVISDLEVLAVQDGYPVTEGHTLVIPRRHVSRLFELPPNEQANLWLFVGRVRDFLATKLNVENFNVGLNDGKLAGQTVPHAHIHIIPRREGDVPDPRGGVRWVIPRKAAYWTQR